MNVCIYLQLYLFQNNLWVLKYMFNELNNGLKIWQEKKMLSERRPSHTQGGVNDVGFTPQG